MNNILKEADEIINKRSQEKERQYGPFSECMIRMSEIYNAMTGQKASPQDMYKAMIALKFARESFNHKTDNLLDAAAYIGALQNFEDENN